MADQPKADPTQTAFLAVDHAGRQIVSVHAKLTYELKAWGECTRAEVQQPFVDDPDLDESDVIAFKNATDLIVLACAYAPSPRHTQMTVGIEYGGFEWNCRVSGDRRCIYRGRGSVEFELPAPFEKIQLCYDNAYGGIDNVIDNPACKVFGDLLKPHPGIYPRNMAGKGYVVEDNPKRIDGLLLPNLENPEQLLTPRTLVAGSPQNWWKQPLPWACDWMELGWFPRSVFLGGVPEYLPEDDRVVEEVRRGWVEGNLTRRWRESEFGDMFDGRFANAAAPALVRPFMKGDEAIRLRGMTPNQEIIVRLPGERPKMQVRFERRTYDLVPVPNRILISTEEKGVYIVWHGAWPTPRTLPERFPRPGDTEAMELEGVEVYIDGKLVPPPASDVVPGYELMRGQGPKTGGAPAK